MQLKAEWTAPPDDRWDEPARKEPEPLSEAMREYEIRRCHICQCQYPPFGFGPPLTPGGTTLWACLTHRPDVGRLVTTAPPRPVNKKQATLFD